MSIVHYLLKNRAYSTYYARFIPTANREDSFIKLRPNIRHILQGVPTPPFQRKMPTPIRATPAGEHIMSGLGFTW